jgi:hypothetical protein
MKTQFNFIAFVFFILLFHNGFSLTIKNDSILNDDSDSLICLEISGRICTDGKERDNFYTVELIEYNTVIKAVIKKDKKAFKFNLEKNKYYAIRIIKEGYAPKLISIHTMIPDEKFAKEFYSFRFKTELFPEEEYKKFDQDAQDFPIAIVAFNKQKRVFDYNEKYTGNIKRSLYKSTASR